MDRYRILKAQSVFLVIFERLKRNALNKIK